MLWALSASVLALVALRLVDAWANRRLRERTRSAIERALQDADRR